MNQTAELDSRQSAAPHAPVSFAQAFGFWLKLGFISFGGPAGQIAIMHRELVEQRRWISERRFLHALNYCMLLPGPEATQLATYIGWMMHRTWGGIVAGTLFVLPSLAILIALSWLYVVYGAHPLALGLLYGIKPAVVAIVLAAAHRIATRALHHASLWLIALAALLALALLHVPFPAIIGAAAAIGWLGGRWRPSWFSPAKSGHGSAQKDYGPALIDDTTPTPAHARFSWMRLVGVLAVGLALWAAPFVLLFSTVGWENALAQMAWFFTKAALLTFGGAYAVLPYVTQAAVQDYGWMSAPQMIDGLALGETTPGPLIMIVAFVGFVGAWAKAALGANALALSGVVGACVATWYTFLPSFVFIFAGAPVIETTHGDLKFTAPLTAITAAVVGVIVNLALFFGYHVFWQHGVGGAFEWRAAVIGIAAAVALLRYKIGVIPVITGCAVAGLLLRFI
jgi:chromate transporter